MNDKSSLTASTNIYILSTILILMAKRVFFSKGNQKKFIKCLKEKSNLGWKELAKKLAVNESTLSKSYLFELSSIPYLIFSRAINLLGEKETEILKKYDAEVEEEIVVIGRKVLGEQKKKFEEINIAFTNKNLDLDCSRVNFSYIDKKKQIKLPNEITPELAEEIGMHYGDGFLSADRYDYRLKGNQYDERKYYQNYIKPLFKELYNLDVNLKDFKTSYGFEITSKALWEFKTKVIGIKPGNKENIIFPDALKVNDVRILTSFLKGLFDTDGSLYFKTRYGYEKYYPEIKLELFSKQLIKEVGKILRMLGFNPNIYLRQNVGIISLNGIEALKRYEKLIGWSSQKNLNKLNDWKNRYSQLNEKITAVVVQWLRRGPVAPETRVRFPPSALYKKEGVI